MNAKLLLISVILAALSSGPVAAEASGPDYFRVVGVAWNDVLNIRAEPTARSAKVGAIPPDGNGVLNYGCVGGMSYAEWEAATPAQREKARKRVWCKVGYRGVVGWAAGWFLAEGSGP